MANLGEEQDLLSKIFDILKSERVFDPKAGDLVFPFKHPQELKSLLCLDLSTGVPCAGSAERENVIRMVIQHSIKTAHPNYHNEMYAAPDLYGLAASWVTDALNACQFTFEAAPVFSLIESMVLEYFLKLCGFEGGEGVFTPGGSIANMYAISMARHKMLPDIKTEGMYGQQCLKIYTSEDAHYSVTKSANWLGLGEANVLKISTDHLSRIDPGALEAALQTATDGQDGSRPLIVSVTAGTTVFGAFDELGKIADICARFGTWMHVDAAWGGAALFSDHYRKLLLNGLERADSVALCPQKLLGAPLQCAMFLSRHKGLLTSCNAACAEYLFQTDKYYDISYDTGDMSVQCGRKVDSFKLWFMLRARGPEWFQLAVENALSCAQYFQRAITENAFFKLVRTKFEFTNVCFWFVPKRLQLASRSGQDETDEWWAEVQKVTLILKERMVKKGSLMVSYASHPCKKLGYFFRLVVKCVPPPTTERMDYIIQEMVAIGGEL
ncbi:cysteine sulfinic acid decarboxylase-like [Culex pipiens pallens]|uniref:cysteine sulfinic acid decarboxylase-like n=1 Tax=Culex pipiens pallens TaxID=42434 RepID=UPI001952A404|nr:cysteine sulfinic acid decarboxylase-like [Culex pipiens pallens]